MIPDISVHPIDFNRWQMENHRQTVYQHAKGTMRCQANKMPSAPIASILQNVQELLSLEPTRLESFKKQLDADKKNTFDEFLQALQREAFFRQSLSNAQIFNEYATRLTWKGVKPLVLRSQLSAVQHLMNENGGYDQVELGEALQKLPSFSYAIQQMCMFSYQGQAHMICIYEGKSVQVFEWESGQSIYEFDLNPSDRKVKQESTPQEALTKGACSWIGKMGIENNRTNSTCEYDNPTVKGQYGGSVSNHRKLVQPKQKADKGQQRNLNQMRSRRLNNNQTEDNLGQEGDLYPNSQSPQRQINSNNSITNFETLNSDLNQIHYNQSATVLRNGGVSSSTVQSQSCNRPPLYSAINKNRNAGNTNNYNHMLGSFNALPNSNLNNSLGQLPNSNPQNQLLTVENKRQTRLGKVDFSVEKNKTQQTSALKQFQRVNSARVPIANFSVTDKINQQSSLKTINSNTKSDGKRMTLDISKTGLQSSFQQKNASTTGKSLTTRFMNQEVLGSNSIPNFSPSRIQSAHPSSSNQMKESRQKIVLRRMESQLEDLAEIQENQFNFSQVKTQKVRKEALNQGHQLKVPIQENFASCLISKMIAPALIDAKKLDSYRKAKKDKERKSTKQTAFTFGVLGIDPIQQDHQVTSGTEGGESSPSRVNDSANPIDQVLKKELKNTISGKLMDTIERQRRNRKTVNPLANSKLHQTVDERLLEFVQSPDQIDLQIYEFHQKIKQLEDDEKKQLKKKQDKDSHHLRPPVHQMMSMNSQNFKEIQEAELSKSDEQTLQKRLNKQFNQLAINRDKVQLGLKALEKKLSQGAKSPSTGKQGPSTVTLLNKMIILNQAADKIKDFNENKQAFKNKYGSREIFDLRQELEEDNNNIYTQKPKAVYQTYFNENQVSLGDVISGPQAINQMAKGDSTKQALREKKLNPIMNKKAHPQAVKCYQTPEQPGLASKSLIMFVTVSDLFIFEVRQQGAKKIFKQQLVHQIDSKNAYMPIQIDIGISKVKNGVVLVTLVCIGTSFGPQQNQQKQGDSTEANKCSKDDAENVLFLFEVDIKNNFKLTEIFTDSSSHTQQQQQQMATTGMSQYTSGSFLNQVPPELRRKRCKPVVQKILLGECGLIIASFFDHIELLDRVEFYTKGVWDNDLKGPSQTGKEEEERLSNEPRKQTGSQKLIEFAEQFAPLRRNSSQNQFMRKCSQSATRSKHGCNERKSSSAIQKQKGVLKRQTSFEDKNQKNPQQSQKNSSSQVTGKRKTGDKQVADKNSGQSSFITISCLDYSNKMDLIAFGSVQGKVGVIDSQTLQFKGVFSAHKTEVMNLYFHDACEQMITVTAEAEIIVWDAARMRIQQVLKNKSQLDTSFLQSTYFFSDMGQLILGTSKVYSAQLIEDEKEKVRISHQAAVSIDFLSQFRKDLQREGILKSDNDISKLSNYSADEKEEKSKIIAGSSPSATKGNIMSNLMAVMKEDQTCKIQNLLAQPSSFVEAIFKPENLTGDNKHLLTRTCNVLPAVNTQLAGFFHDQDAKEVFTLDVDCLLRQWSLKTGMCLKSYPLEILHQSHASCADETEVAYTHKAKIQACSLLQNSDFPKKCIVVAFEQGHVQVFNLYTGAILFNRKSPGDQLYCGEDVTRLQFYTSSNNFWFVATCLKGKVAFFTPPLLKQGQEFIQCKRCPSLHLRDVICIDISDDNHTVTGSIDNMICFWQTFTGTVQKSIQIPHSVANPFKRNLQHLKFAERDNQDFVICIMSDGLVLCLDAIAEQFFLDDKDDAILAKVAKQAVIDLQNEYLLCLGTNGQEGHLLKIHIKKGLRGQALNDRHKVKLSVIQKFSYGGGINNGSTNRQKPLKEDNNIIQVSLHISLSMFIVATLDGRISFHSLTNFDKLCYLNDQMWEPNIFYRFSQAYNVGKQITSKTFGSKLQIEGLQKIDKYAVSTTDLTNLQSDRTLASTANQNSQSKIISAKRGFNLNSSRTRSEKDLSFSKFNTDRTTAE